MTAKRQPGFMTAREAVQFAFDWSPFPFIKPICCTCLKSVRRHETITHMDEQHPGWLDAWNNALRASGL
jgi:hypothetical protein